MAELGGLLWAVVQPVRGVLGVLSGDRLGAVRCRDGTLRTRCPTCAMSRRSSEATPTRRFGGGVFTVRSRVSPAPKRAHGGSFPE